MSCLSIYTVTNPIFNYQQQHITSNHRELEEETIYSSSERNPGLAPICYAKPGLYRSVNYKFIYLPANVNRPRADFFLVLWYMI